MSTTSSTLSIKKLHELYLSILTEYQSFMMALYDTRTLQKHNIISYGIDGYDLCRFIFPKKWFRYQNPHHDTMQTTWETFFNNCDPNLTPVCISPFTLLELFATVDKNLSDKRTKEIIEKQFPDIISRIEHLIKGEKKMNDISNTEQQFIKHLYNDMRGTQITIKMLKNEKIFPKLKKLIEANKIITLDNILDKVSRHMKISNILLTPSEYFKRALNYLTNARLKKDLNPQFVDFYSKIDIYHYYLFANVEKILYRNRKHIKPYITSSGVLSRNSWVLAGYGRLFDDITGIDEKWAGRSSTVPLYIARAYSYFNKNLKECKFFFEEGMALARVILRDLLAIPELSSNISELLEKYGPPIKVPNKIAQAVLRFQRDYLPVVFPEITTKPILSGSDIPYEGINLEKLVDWLKDPQKRGKVYNEGTERVRSQVRELQIMPFEWNAYIAPIGQRAYDILKTYDSGLDA